MVVKIGIVQKDFAKTTIIFGESTGHLLAKGRQTLFIGHIILVALDTNSLAAEKKFLNIGL